MEERLSNRDPLQNEGSLYSIATSYAIDTLEGLIKTRQLSSKTVLGFSVSTLIRNRLDPSSSINDILSGVNQEIEVILDDLTQLLLDNGYTTNTFLFYLYDYSRAVPSEHRRSSTPSRDQLQLMIDSAIAQRSKVFGNIGHYHNNFKVHTTYSSKRSSVHRFLSSEIKKLGREVILLTHNPLDLHVTNLGLDVKLLRSHTGDIVESKDFGKKILKRDHIPFNEYTHLLFGDKDNIKPHLGIKRKNELLEIAEKEHWEVRSHNDVLVRIRRYDFKPPLKL